MNELKTEFKKTLENGEFLTVQHTSLKKAINRLKALHHSLRIQILKLLEEQEKMTVTEIFVKLRIEQSVVSQHLAVLRTAKLVNTQRDGKFIFYSINYDQIAYLQNMATDLLK